MELAKKRLRELPDYLKLRKPKQAFASQGLGRWVQIRDQELQSKLTTRALAHLSDEKWVDSVAEFLFTKYDRSWAYHALSDTIAFYAFVRALLEEF